MPDEKTSPQNLVLKELNIGSFFNKNLAKKLKTF